PSDWLRSGEMDPAKYPNLVAVSMLVNLLGIVLVLTVLCVVVPLALTPNRPPLRAHGSLLGYFGALGLGVLVVEVALLQRLTVFLGHPTYALTTILFALLIAGGAGSFLSGRLGSGRASQWVPLVGLLAAVVLVGLATGPALKLFEASGAAVRVAVAAGLVGVAGLFMGMALPTGMRVATATAPRLIPWLWGVNGATSVFGSVLAAAVALAFGISTSYWAGLACYAVAAVALHARRGERTAVEQAPAAAEAIRGSLSQPTDAECAPVST